MPRNLEFKVKVTSHSDILNILKKISATYISSLHQKDTYFFTKNGRLKIRENDKSSYELISYMRIEEDYLRWSEYETFFIEDLDRLKNILIKTLGVKSVVTKQRELFFYKNCRIHLDKVEGLGEFIELEVMSDKSDNNEKELMDYLIAELSPYLLRIYRESYSDLLTISEKA